MESAQEVPTEVKHLVLALPNRYRDAYAVAKVTSNMGKLIQKISLRIGFVVIAVGVAGIANAFLARSALLSAPDFFGPVGGGAVIVIGVLFLASGYWFGTLIAAQGQVIRAVVDIAVNTSPLMSADMKARLLEGTQA